MGHCGGFPQAPLTVRHDELGLEDRAGSCAGFQVAVCLKQRGRGGGGRGRRPRACWNLSQDQGWGHSHVRLSLSWDGIPGQELSY